MAITTVFFDFMGTCLNWHSAIVSALPASLSGQIKSSFALTWRHEYFDASAKRLEEGLPYEDIDITHRRTLDQLLEREEWASVRDALDASAGRGNAATNKTADEEADRDGNGHEDDEARDELVQAWHRQPAWAEVRAALLRLKARGYEIFVHANGTTRLQLDLTRFSGLTDFELLFSSQLLGDVYKPAPEAYHRALRLLKREAGQCVMVAAHVRDLRGAMAVGMKGVYVRRWTDDIHDDPESIKAEVDAYMEDMQDLDEVVGRL